MASCYHRLTAGLTESSKPAVQTRNLRPSLAVSLIRRNHLCQRPGLVLRSPSRAKLSAVEAAGITRERPYAAVKCDYAVGDREIGDFGGDRDRRVGIERQRRDRAVEVMVAAAATVALGVGNRVMYKLALVPLKQYPFFLAQLATFGVGIIHAEGCWELEQNGPAVGPAPISWIPVILALEMINGAATVDLGSCLFRWPTRSYYVAVYFSILYLRYHAGVVTDEMLSAPKAPFIAVGLLEALAAASGMAAGAILSGASIPILSQTFLVWQIILSILFLGRKYRINELVGCALVAIGVIITVTSGSGASHSLKEAGIFWSLLMIVSFLFQAADTVLKEVIFLDSAERLKEGSLDLFVVNSFGSAFQALFICLLLPFLSKLWGIPFSRLPSYLRDGAACFLNIGGSSTGCDGAPLLPLLFVLVNMGYNISLLHLIKVSSAVVSCLASTVSVPIAIYVFTLPLPYLGVASSLPTGFVAGAVVLVIGMLIYAWTPPSGPTSPASSLTG